LDGYRAVTIGSTSQPNWPGPFVSVQNSPTSFSRNVLRPAHPPTGISCTFSPNSANLTVNGSSTTTLKVNVNSKPTSGAGFPPLRLPVDQRSFPRSMPLQFAMSLLVLATLLGAIGLRRSTSFRTLAPKLSLALFLLLAISMTSCTSASVTGSGGSSGGNGSPAAVSLVVQGTSGSTVVPLGTISITVP
jgi:hypothetical protein